MSIHQFCAAAKLRLRKLASSPELIQNIKSESEKLSGKSESEKFAAKLRLRKLASSPELIQNAQHLQKAQMSPIDTESQALRLNVYGTQGFLLRKYGTSYVGLLSIDARKLSLSFFVI